MSALLTLIIFIYLLFAIFFGGVELVKKHVVAVASFTAFSLFIFLQLGLMIFLETLSAVIKKLNHDKIEVV